MKNYKYYYVVCILNETEVLSAGVQSVDLDFATKTKSNPAELAVCDYFDATNIPYEDTWEDHMWDNLDRYAYEIDEHTYKTKQGLPKSDADILKYIENNVDALGEDEQNPFSLGWGSTSTGTSSVENAHLKVELVKNEGFEATDKKTGKRYIITYNLAAGTGLNTDIVCVFECPSGDDNYYKFMGWRMCAMAPDMTIDEALEMFEAILY